MTHYTKSSLVGTSKDDSNDILDGLVTVTADTRFQGSIIPFSSCTFNLGSSLLFWNNIHGCKIFIDDANFFMDLENTNNDAKISFDAGDHILYDRTANQFQFKIGANPNPDVTIENGITRVSNKLEIANATTFIEKTTTGGSNGDVQFQLATNDDIVWDSSENILTYNIASNPVLLVKPGAVEIPSTSTLQVDTIVESTSANGTSIEGVGFKDSLVNSNLSPLTDKSFQLGDNTHRWEILLLQRGSTGSQIIITDDDSDLPDAAAVKTIILGGNCGNGSMDGQQCTLIGYDTGIALTTADSVIGIGTGVLTLNTTSSELVSIGNNSAKKFTGTQSCFYGHNAALNCTSQAHLAVFGHGALLSATSGTGRNSAYGRNALNMITTGRDNSGFGYTAGDSITLGDSFHTFMGSMSGVGSAGLAETSALGYNAKAQASFDVQLGQRTDAGSGQGFFRTQKFQDETWIDAKVKPAVIDGTGNTTKEDTSGAVTQITSITTTVILNNRIGLITTVSSTLAAEAVAKFTVTNNKVLATGDLVRCWLQDYAGGTGDGLPTVHVDNVAVGSFQVVVQNCESVNALAALLKIGFEIINV
jgi:hypothetical protein